MRIVQWDAMGRRPTPCKKANFIAPPGPSPPLTRRGYGTRGGVQMGSAHTNFTSLGQVNIPQPVFSNSFQVLRLTLCTTSSRSTVSVELSALRMKPLRIHFLSCFSIFWNHIFVNPDCDRDWHRWRIFIIIHRYSNNSEIFWTYLKDSWGYEFDCICISKDGIWWSEGNRKPHLIYSYFHFSSFFHCPVSRFTVRIWRSKMRRRWRACTCCRGMNSRLAGLLAGELFHRGWICYVFARF